MNRPVPGPPPRTPYRPPALPPAPRDRPRQRTPGTSGPKPDRPTSWPDLYQRLERAGCEVVPTRNRRCRIHGPDGGLYIAALSSKDSHAIRNVISGVRKTLGIDVTKIR